MNPAGDLELGAEADIPQCEFWAQGYAAATEYSCIEAVSIGHTMGRNIVAAEAFTAAPGEYWQKYPGNMKSQADWALCCGINRFIFHRYQHQPWLNRWPGMTMGNYGVNWERTQTWWSMASGFHTYLARCQALLRRGLPVADVLYLSPEGAPMVLFPPGSATQSSPPDRLGYNFDGCAPSALINRASVTNGSITFPDGMSYKLLVLPEFDTMTPELLSKVNQLVMAGATVVGAPPRKSPSLSGYPGCDQQVAQLATNLWGSGSPIPVRAVGNGFVIYDAEASAVLASAYLNQNLSVAKWIWYPEGSPASSAPVATRYFQKDIYTSAGHPSDQRHPLVDCGQFFPVSRQRHHEHSRKLLDTIPTPRMWRRFSTRAPISFISRRPMAETSPNPAGLICTLLISLNTGSNITVVSDNSWNSAQSANGPWQSALELGPWNMSPWNLSAAASANIYPSYGFTGQVLTNMGVPPDFQSDGGLPLYPPARWRHEPLFRKQSAGSP